jgi:hypothetical protein
MDIEEAMRKVRQRLVDYQATKQTIQALQLDVQSAIERHTVAVELQNTAN